MSKLGSEKEYIGDGCSVFCNLTYAERNGKGFMRHLFDTDEEYEARRCTFIKENNERCRSVKAAGFHTCAHHLSPDEKKQYKKLKDAKTSAKEIKETPTCCRFVSPSGKPCKGTVLHGRDVCWAHATPQEKKSWRASRRRAKEKQYRDPNLHGQSNPKKHKPYDGYLATVDTEKIVEVADGEVYGFYGGAFLNKEQRELFKSAPVGDIDDDIRVVRFLLRDALESQILFLQAQARGDVEKGWVIFSKDVAETIDEGGRIIASTTRIIKRKRDYLKDIAHLQKLVTSMETARIAIKSTQEEMDKEINPFSFNVLPPSDDHPIYGTNPAEEITE